MASCSISSTSASEMDPDTTLELVRKGATLLFLDVPQFTLLGVDTQRFSTGPKFKGIKMIPPGPHFVYYCSSNKEGNEFAPTVGFFLTTHPSEVIVRKWHPQDERLIKLSEEEEFRYSEAVRHLEFDNQLGPYNLNYHGDWKQLSGYLSQSVIERLEPIGGEITIAYESAWMDKAPKTAMEKHLMEQIREGKFAKDAHLESEKRGCYYTTIPTAVKNKDISGDQLTALNLDKTSLLETILAKHYGGQEDVLLGEIQFSFVAFMMGQSLEAFMQWKALVSLLLSCGEAPLHTRTNMFVKFIRVIYCQLKHGFQRSHDTENGKDMDNSLFLDESWLSKDIFLYRLCKDFFPLVFEAPMVDGDLLLWKVLHSGIFFFTYRQENSSHCSRPLSVGILITMQSILLMKMMNSLLLLYKWTKQLLEVPHSSELTGERIYIKSTFCRVMGRFGTCLHAVPVRYLHVETT